MSEDGKVTLGVEARVYNATIRERRQRLGLTQKQVAEMAGVHHWVVGQLETLRRPQVGDPQRKVLRVLGLDEEASPAWLAALELHGVRRVTKDVTAELVAKPELLGLPMNTTDLELEEASDPHEYLADRLDGVKGLDALPERERLILERRYGNPPQTFEAIGYDLDLTPERVRQIELTAMKHLRVLNGICGKCETRPQAEGKTLCPKCLHRFEEMERARREQKMRGWR